MKNETGDVKSDPFVFAMDVGIFDGLEFSKEFLKDPTDYRI